MKLSVGVKIPPVPKSLSLDTPGVESRIRLGDIPATEIERIADRWWEAFVSEAEKQRAKQVEK